MLQHAEPAAHAAEAGHAAAEAFDAGDDHRPRRQQPIDHPLIHLPTIAGIDLSVTKHVLMLWVVAPVLLLVTTTRCGATSARTMVPSGPVMGLFEIRRRPIRDEIVAPNVGSKWVDTYTPLILVFFLFIVTANAIGLIPIFDVLALLNHTVLHLPEDSFLAQVRTAARRRPATSTSRRRWPRSRSSPSSSPASRAHGFVGTGRTWCRTACTRRCPCMLIPIEIMGMFVRPFALTMRLAANMTGGHIAILAILSLVFIFAEMAAGWSASASASSVGAAGGRHLGAGDRRRRSVQAYVFTLLTAVFIGMAIHAHH